MVRFSDGTIFVVDKKQEGGQDDHLSTYDLGIGLDTSCRPCQVVKKTQGDVL